MTYTALHSSRRCSHPPHYHSSLTESTGGGELDGVAADTAERVNDDV